MRLRITDEDPFECWKLALPFGPYLLRVAHSISVGLFFICKIVFSLHFFRKEISNIMLSKIKLGLFLNAVLCSLMVSFPDFPYLIKIIAIKREKTGKSFRFPSLISISIKHDRTQRKSESYKKRILAEKSLLLIARLLHGKSVICSSRRSMKEEGKNPPSRRPGAEYCSSFNGRYV